MIEVTPIYGALFALVFLVLSVRIVLHRRHANIALGDGGDRLLLRLMRAQANSAEYGPLILILMLLAELQSAPAVALHALGVLLIAGRLLHALGVSREPETIRLRVAGMALTFTALGLGALATLGHALFG